MAVKIWLLFSFVLAVSFATVNASADSTTIEGKLARDGYKDLLLVTPDGNTYVLSDMKNKISSLYLGDDAMVKGTINKEKRTIMADEIEVKKDGGWKTVWSLWWSSGIGW